MNLGMDFDDLFQRYVVPSLGQIAAHLLAAHNCFLDIGAILDILDDYRNRIVAYHFCRLLGIHTLRGVKLLDTILHCGASNHCLLQHLPSVKHRLAWSIVGRLVQGE